MPSDYVFVGYDSTIAGFDKVDESIVQRQGTTGGNVTDISLDRRNRAFSVTEEGIVSCDDPDGNATSWDTDLGFTSILANPPQIDNNNSRVFVVDGRTGQVYILDSYDGSLEQQISPTDVTDARDIQATSDNGFVIAAGKDTTGDYGIIKFDANYNEEWREYTFTDYPKTGTLHVQDDEIYVEDSAGDSYIYDINGNALVTDNDLGVVTCRDYTGGGLYFSHLNDDYVQKRARNDINNTVWQTSSYPAEVFDVDSDGYEITRSTYRTYVVWNYDTNTSPTLEVLDDSNGAFDWSKTLLFDQNDTLVVGGSPNSDANGEFEQVTATQTSASATQNTTQAIDKVFTTQIQSIATMEAGSVSISQPAAQTSATASMLKGFVTPITSTQTSATATVNTAEAVDLKGAIRVDSDASMNDAQVSSLSLASQQVSSPATMNTLPPVDESISGTQTAAVATLNTIPPLDESLTSTQVQTVVDADQGVVSNFLRVTPYTVSATPNDGSVGDYTRTVQNQATATATMNESPLFRDTTGLGGTFWRIEQGDFTEILIDAVSVENGYPDFTVGEEMEMDVVLTRNDHRSDYERLREYGDFLSSVSHSTGTDYQQRPYYGERLHPDSTFDSTLWLLEPGPGISEADSWWVVVTGVDDNIQIGGTGGTMTLQTFVLAPGDEAPRSVIEDRYEVQG